MHRVWLALVHDDGVALCADIAKPLPAPEIIKIALFLFGTYLGTIMILRSSDEIYISIPFVKFSPVAHRKRDLIIDTSALSDPRLIDLCSSGLLLVVV